MRYAQSFTNDIGTLTIPTRGRSEQLHQVEFRDAVLQGFRHDGAFDMWGEGRAPLARGEYVTTFLLEAASESAFETAKDSMSQILAGDPGKLKFNTIGAALELYTFARPGRPSIRYQAGSAGKWAHVTVPWRLTNGGILYRNLGSDIDSYIATSAEVTVGASTFGENWDERTFASLTISASPTTFTIASWPGSFRTNRALIRVEALAANGFSNFKIENLTTGQEITSTFAGASTSHFWQVNCAINRPMRSTNGGTTWSNDWENCSIAALQAPIMEFVPGNNSMRVTSDGVSNYRVMFLGLPAYLF